MPYDADLSREYQDLLQEFIDIKSPFLRLVGIFSSADLVEVTPYQPAVYETQANPGFDPNLPVSDDNPQTIEVLVQEEIAATYSKKTEYGNELTDAQIDTRYDYAKAEADTILDDFLAKINSLKDSQTTD